MAHIKDVVSAWCSPMRSTPKHSTPAHAVNSHEVNSHVVNFRQINFPRCVPWCVPHPPDQLNVILQRNELMMGNWPDSLLRESLARKTTLPGWWWVGIMNLAASRLGEVLSRDPTHKERVWCRWHPADFSGSKFIACYMHSWEMITNLCSQKKCCLIVLK